MTAVRMTAAVAAAEAIAPFDVAALENRGIPALPAEREALRRRLRDAIARIRPILEADAEANDAGQTLAWPSVVALYRKGLLAVAEGSPGAGRAGVRSAAVPGIGELDMRLI